MSVQTDTYQRGRQDNRRKGNQQPAKCSEVNHAYAMYLSRERGAIEE